MRIKTGIITERLDIEEEIREIIDETSREGGGALTMFIGYVKGVVNGQRVYELEYSVYEPYTSKTLENIAREVADKYNLLAVSIYHRVGCLKPGEPTLYIIVSSRDRESSFNACREILERVKKEPPIFKLEKREDGEYWVIGDGERVKRFKQ